MRCDLRALMRTGCGHTSAPLGPGHRCAWRPLSGKEIRGSTVSAEKEQEFLNEGIRKLFLATTNTMTAAFMRGTTVGPPSTSWLVRHHVSGDVETEVRPQHGPAFGRLRPPTRLSTVRSPRRPTASLARWRPHAGCVGWIGRRFATLPRAPLALASRGSRGARRKCLDSAHG